MMHTFSTFIDQLVTDQTAVMIGTGGERLGGTIIAFDHTLQVVTFQTGRTKHFIPLSSIRSFGMEENDSGCEITMELFKR